MTHSLVHLCERCRLRKKGPRNHLWICRHCKRQTCEHACTDKGDGARATCGKCSTPKNQTGIALKGMYR